MLILPLDYPEPFAATLGVMLYPAADDPDSRKARAYAAQYLAEPIRQLHETGAILSHEELFRIATDAGERLDDLDKRWWGATVTGEIFKVFFILANTEPTLASWSNAIRVAEVTAARRKVSGARSALRQALSKFKTVSHLWGAWSIRGGEFSPQPEVGYDGYADFQSFLAEAEILRTWGRSWRAARDKAEPPLPEDVWQVPEDWRPLACKPGWPETGAIPRMTLPEDLIRDLKSAGRPRKRT